MSACIPASLAGTRVFTATASQGLLLMHELLHYASGARAPIVMANVNRTVASPWAFWPDQTDSLAQRDTGWVQLYVESAQEALDSVPQAFRVAEQVLLPVMVNLDAFYVSHAMEPVDVPAQADVDAYLPPFAPQQRLDTAVGSSWGNVVSQDMFYRHRQALQAAMDARAAAPRAGGRRLAASASVAAGAWSSATAATARATVIVTMGSMAGTAREAVDAMRDAGEPVGFVRLRLFRPLPRGRTARGARRRARRRSCSTAITRPASAASCTRSCARRCAACPARRACTDCSRAWAGSTCRPRKIVDFVRAARDAEPTAESQWVR